MLMMPWNISFGFEALMLVFYEMGLNYASWLWDVNLMIMIRCLLCIVGSVHIKTKEALAKDIFKDLMEMCYGIQNPSC
jgi:hypothetical protein